MSRVVASGLFALCSVAAVPCQRDPAAPSAPAAPAAPKPPGPDAVLPPGEFALPKLVELGAAACGRNILWNGREDHDPRPIALTEPVPLAPETAMETLRSLLYTRGLGILPVDPDRGVFEVVSFLGQRGHEFERHVAPATPERCSRLPTANAGS